MSDEQDYPYPQLSKVPTGLGEEPLNIVILGSSYAGLACAHYFFDHVMSNLRTFQSAPNYRLIIVSPSTHFYWNIAAPRALASPDAITQNDLFIPIESAFHRHRGHNFCIIQGDAIALDPEGRTVTVELIGSTAQKRASQVNKRSSFQLCPPTRVSISAKVQTIPYHALIVATGSSSHSDLLTLHGPHFHSIGALSTFHARLAAAKSVVVCGGGPSGVETAGQLAAFANLCLHTGLFCQKPSKSVTLITGGDRCLPRQKQKVGLKAERMLKKRGVEIRQNVRVVGVKESFDLSKPTRIELDDNTTIEADLCILCTGVEPNTSYAPTEFKDAEGYVLTNSSSMRVDHPLAGGRVYAIGDAASYSRNCIADVYAAVPVLMRNLEKDLLIYERGCAPSKLVNEVRLDELEDARYVPILSTSQLCPIGSVGGVGTVRDESISSFAVHRLKGARYRTPSARRVVEYGANSYPWEMKSSPFDFLYLLRSQHNTRRFK